MLVTLGAYLNAQMQAAIGDHPHVGEVRGEGMMCAVEFVKDKDSRTFFDPSQKIGPQIAGALVEKKKSLVARCHKATFWVLPRHSA